MKTLIEQDILMISRRYELVLWLSLLGVVIQRMVQAPCERIFHQLACQKCWEKYKIEKENKRLEYL